MGPWDVEKIKVRPATRIPNIDRVKEIVFHYIVVSQGKYGKTYRGVNLPITLRSQPLLGRYYINDMTDYLTSYVSRLYDDMFIVFKNVYSHINE